MASSVIYYSTEAQKNEIYLFYVIIKLAKVMRNLQNQLAKLDLAISDVITRVYFNNTQLTTNENAERTLIVI